MDSDTILEMRNISKSFGPVQALKNIDFKVRRGEIHGLVGENGAGKSTLMKILSGVYPYGDYSGEIVYNGEPQRFRGIKDSESAGIAIIYQELALIPEMTIYENIYLGHEIKKGITIDWNNTVVKAGEMLKKVKLDIDSSIKVKELGVGIQQLVEIAKAFSKNVDLLILDEPTSALNEDDSENLLSLLRALRSDGITSIIISHKLKEITAIADTVTVLRDGESVCSIQDKELITEPRIIRNMVGRDMHDVYPKREKYKPREEVFRTENLTVYDPRKGREILTDINVNARAGEVVGIAGLMGAGRTEFAYSVFGNTRDYRIKGDIYVSGEKRRLKSPSDAMKAGLAYVSEDRKKEGLFLRQDIKNNITLTNLKSIANMGVVNQNEEVNIANDYMKKLDIRASGIDQIVGNLSGGNQQKVSISKWLYTGPKILILDEPTRGIDVGAKFEIYTIVNELAAQGMAVIFISSELPEILGVSDRIYVISEGRLTGELGAEEATADSVMSLAIL